MHIGIFIESAPDTGGAFNQALSATESIVRGATPRHQFTVFTPHPHTKERVLKLGMKAVCYRRGFRSLLDRWTSTTAGYSILHRLRAIGLARVGRELDALLDDHGIDLVVFNECAEAALRVGDHPFIATVFDMDHRDHPEFPEVFGDRVFERRERWFQNTLNRAVAVVANSELQSQRIATLHRVATKRIVELPFLPSLPIRQSAAAGTIAGDCETLKKYSLSPGYVFYPSFYSFHKNHLYVLEALAELSERTGSAPNAVFCGGGDPGDQEKVERQVEALELADIVRFLGVVPEADLPCLYRNALALVMPSYFGPTNLPPVEAIVLGCPVVCSDLPGCREQLGEAALYCDLSTPSSLAGILKSIRDNPDVVIALQSKARYLATSIFAINYGERLLPIFDEMAFLQRRWITQT